jgi:hypothetical protein
VSHFGVNLLPYCCVCRMEILQALATIGSLWCEKIQLRIAPTSLTLSFLRATRRLCGTRHGTLFMASSS